MKPDQSRLDEMVRLLKAEGWGLTPPDRYLTDMDEVFLEIWKLVQSYTMISAERAWALSEAVRYVSNSGIPGDIVECGVWKGGACLLASLVLNLCETETQRRIWLYDTFEGMVEPGEEDRIASSGQALTERNPEGWWSAGLEEVKKNLQSSPLPLESFRFVPGRVERTLCETLPGQIAILRLDTDWYESTRKELEVLYPLLSKGGILIIDDYGHFTGARKAVDDYFRERDETILLHRSDYTGRVLIKN